ncbi:hypothetical protein [Streptomyces sp. NPDC057287]|uniref:hypothetical protein n=1 Tax=Streptomyces sp. NPDC057287 TaxID=3346086 RepID=UPI0036309ED2
MDVKELAQRHVERVYGEGEWTLFPARDLKPGMILGRDTWKDGDREVVSVDVDPEAQTVSVELSSENARELGLTLDDTCAIDAMVRVKVQPKPEPSVIVGDRVSFYDCTATVTAVSTGWVEFVRPDGTTGRKPADHDFQVIGHAEPETEAPMTVCGLRRIGWERPGTGARRLPCTLPTGHTQPHRDAFRHSFVRSEDDAAEDKVTAPVPTEVGQVIDLHPFTAIVDVIAGTGVLIAPPASDDLSVSAGGASLHDALLTDVMRRLALLGVESLEGEDDGLSLEGVTDDGRKVFSLYVSDCITTEPDFEEVACSIEALRRAAGLGR